MSKNTNTPKKKKFNGPRPAEYNPRRIDPKALAGLRQSLKIFGDLSGFVINEKTGNIVCGHQRMQARWSLEFTKIQWGEQYSAELGRLGARFISRERQGWASATTSSPRFHVRRVFWPVEFEKAANIAANNPHLQGEFTDGISALINELRNSDPDMVEQLNLEQLLEEMGSEENAEIVPREVPPPPPLTWVLLAQPEPEAQPQAEPEAAQEKKPEPMVSYGDLAERRGAAARKAVETRRRKLAEAKVS